MQLPHTPQRVIKRRQYKYGTLNASVEILMSNRVSCEQWKPLISHFVFAPIDSLYVDSIQVSGLSQTTCNKWSGHSSTETKLSFLEFPGVHHTRFFQGVVVKKAKIIGHGMAESVGSQMFIKLWRVIFVCSSSCRLVTKRKANDFVILIMLLASDRIYIKKNQTFWLLI